MVLRLSKSVAESVFLCLSRAIECDRLAHLVGWDIDNQVGPSVVIELGEKDARLVLLAVRMARGIDRISRVHFAAVKRALRNAGLKEVQQ